MVYCDYCDAEVRRAVCVYLDDGGFEMQCYTCCLNYIFHDKPTVLNYLVARLEDHEDFEPWVLNDMTLDFGVTFHEWVQLYYELNNITTRNRLGVLRQLVELAEKHWPEEAWELRGRYENSVADTNHSL